MGNGGDEGKGNEGCFEGQIVGKLFWLQGIVEGWRELRIGGLMRCKL